MLVEKAQPFPIECVVRGYLAGSGWKEYRASQSVCGIKLPAGLQEASRLENPIFTPSTKAQTGTTRTSPGKIRSSASAETRPKSCAT